MRGSRRDNQPAIFRNVRDRFGRGANKKIDTEHAFGWEWRHDHWRRKEQLSGFYLNPDVVATAL